MRNVVPTLNFSAVSSFRCSKSSFDLLKVNEIIVKSTAFFFSKDLQTVFISVTVCAGEMKITNTTRPHAKNKIIMRASH